MEEQHKAKKGKEITASVKEMTRQEECRRISQGCFRVNFEQKLVNIFYLDDLFFRCNSLKTCFFFKEKSIFLKTNQPIVFLFKKCARCILVCDVYDK